MKRNKNQFPGIPRDQTIDPVRNVIAENVELLTGARGKNRALLLSDLVNLDDMKRRSLIQAANNNNSGGLPIVPGGGIEPPHAPVNLQGTGGFTFIALTWNAPNYKGHAYAEIYRADTDSFSEAVRIATEVTDIFSDSVNMGSAYYYWVRFVNKADMKGPTQGASGLLVETQQSAEQILGEIGGQIEKSHLGNFLTTEVDKIPRLSLDVGELKVDVPSIKEAVFDTGGLVDTIKQEADEAKSTANNVLSSNESLARNLIDAALVGDLNWQNNAVSLIALEASINGVKATIESEFYTRTEADTAIAAAATTIQTMIEETGFSLSGDIEATYYTKTTTNEAIALATTSLKTEIEDINGASVGATLFNDYYTKVSADNAISAAGDTLKAEIEDPTGSSLGATLFTNYYTEADTDSAIAIAGIALKAAIEDPTGSSLGATLVNDYRTTVDTDAAISQASNLLKSDIENPEGDSLGAELFNYYETKADSDKSTAKSIFELSSTFEKSAEAVLDNAIANDIESDRQRVIAANLIQQQKTFADESQALTETLQLLESQFNDSNASVFSLTQTIANNIQATAKKMLLLTSEINGVSADVYENFYTKVDANSAIATADNALKAIIEDPEGSSIGADLQTNYYTKATANDAISEARTQLKGEIENPDGNSIGADLVNNYYTKTNVDSAISQASTALKSTIDTEYADADAAMLSAISSDLQLNYYTKVATNEAISNATTQLKSIIENPSGSSVGADLYNNYYTKTTTNNAISQANQTLKSQIEDAQGNSVGAALQTLSQTVATNDEQWAMWGVKATVRDITASFGLVNDGTDPIFAIKGAKFAIITDQDPNNLTPVFSTVGNKTVIKSALIDQAFIQSLVTDNLLSNRVVVGSELQTPSINYNKNTGARSQNFSMDPNGVIHAKAAVLESVVIKDASGNVVMSSTGAINSSQVDGLGSLAALNSLGYDALTGKPALGSLAALDSLGYDALTGKPTLGTLASLNALSYNALTGKPTLGSLAALDSITYDSVTGKPTLGPFAGLTKILKTNITTYIESGAIGSAQIDQAYIDTLFGNNATFLGTVYAEKIEGDLVDGDITSVSASASTVTGDWVTIKTLTISRSNKFDAWLAIDDIVPSFDKRSGFGVLYTRLKYGSSTGKAVAIYKGSSSVSVSIQVKAVEVPIAETPVDVYVPQQNVALNMFRKGSGFIN